MKKEIVECLISVGVLSEGWDNPNCNVIVHLDQHCQKFFGDSQLVGVLRSAQNKKKCL